MDGTWKLRAEPWIALDGPRAGNLEAVTLWASRREHTPGLFIENKGQYSNVFSRLLRVDVARGVVTALHLNQEIDLPGDFTTMQLRDLGFNL